MRRDEIEKRYLSLCERLTSGLIGLLFLGFSIYLIFSPPIQQTIKNNTDGVEITRTNTNQATVVVCLLTAGSLLAFYAINGLRFNKISAGPLSGESESGQGSTPPLEPSPVARDQHPRADLPPIDLFNTLSDGEKKILRTLWKYQKLTFPEDTQKRWTFKIFAGTLEHPTFLKSVSELLIKGLVSVNPENDQCALTNDGMILMGELGDEANRGNYYSF